MEVSVSRLRGRAHFRTADPCLLLSILYALTPQSVVLRPAGMESPGACPALAHWPYPRPARAESVLYKVTKEVMEMCCFLSLVLSPRGTGESIGGGFNKREFLGPHLRLSHDRPGLWPEWAGVKPSRWLCSISCSCPERWQCPEELEMEPSASGLSG